jgi:hypothetical protein
MPSSRQLVDEFVGNKINKVRWLPMDEKSNVVYFVAGGWDEENEAENPLSLWSFELPISSRYDGRDEEETEEEEDDRMRLRWSLNHFGSVQDLTVCGNHIFTASSNGGINFFSFDQKEHKIKEVKKRTQQQQQSFHKGSCNVVVVSVGEDAGEPKRIVTGGEDGVWNHLQATESDFIKRKLFFLLLVLVLLILLVLLVLLPLINLIQFNNTRTLLRSTPSQLSQMTSLPLLVQARKFEFGTSRQDQLTNETLSKSK